MKTNYPDNPVLWLRDAASYLNLTLDAQLPVEISDPFSDRPLSLITKETKKTLTALYEEVGDAGRQTGFETLLANMAHEMAKGAIGFRAFEIRI